MTKATPEQHRKESKKATSVKRLMEIIRQKDKTLEQKLKKIKALEDFQKMKPKDLRLKELSHGGSIIDGYDYDG